MPPLSKNQKAKLAAKIDARMMEDKGEHGAGRSDMKIDIESPIEIPSPPTRTTSTSDLVPTESELSDDYTEPPMFNPNFEAVDDYNPAIHKTIIEEQYLYSAAYTLINGNALGIPKYCNLNYRSTGHIESPNQVMHTAVFQMNLHGHFMLRLSILRDRNYKGNMFKPSTYTTTMTVALADVVALKISHAGDFSIPKEFHAPADWTGEDIALMTFSTAKLRVTNLEVPRLLDAEAEARLITLFRHIDEVRSKNGVFHFQVLIDDFEPGFGIIRYKWQRDRTRNPIAGWFANNDTDFQLRQNNIQPKDKRPPLSNRLLSLQLRHTYRDAIEMKLYHIYAMVIEHEYAKSLKISGSATQVSAAFASVPGTSFKWSTIDDDQPKIIRVSVPWPSTLKAPTRGDRFWLTMPFEVPDVSVYGGGKINWDPRLFTDDLVEIDCDYPAQIIGAETLKTKQERNTQWRAVFLGSDELSIPGEIAMWAHRPKNSLWEGPDENRPAVGTKIPVHNTEFQKANLYLKYLKNEAERHLITITPIDSDRSYEDIIRNMNNYFELMDDPEQSPYASVFAAQHILQLSISGDITLPFPVQDLSATCSAPLLEKCISSLTAYQAERFLATISNVEHGIALFQGCPAAGKTVCLELSALLWTSIPGGKQVLMTTDTNAGVNDLAARLAQRASKYGMSRLLIIRVHSIEAEIDRFITRYVKNHKLATVYFETVEQDHMPLITTKLHDLASEVESKQVDKRWVEGIQSLDLNAAIDAYFNANQGDADVVILRNSLLIQEEYATFLGAKKLRKLVKEMINNVCAAADIIVTTCGLALDSSVQVMLHPGLIVKDEDVRSIPQVFFALIGAYPHIQMVVLGTDTRQKEAYIQSGSSAEGVNAFVSTLRYSAFMRFKDAGIKVFPLLQQHRMWHPKFVKYISEHHYGDAMTDGNAALPEPPQVKFMREFHKAAFNIDSNVLVIKTSNSHAITEEGGTSLLNMGHLRIMQDYRGKLEARLEATALDFDKSDLDTGYISTYLAQVNAAYNMIVNKEISGVSPHTIETVQGLGFGSGCRDILNYKLSNMAGDMRDSLVADTRWKFGMVWIINGSCLDPKTYNHKREFDMHRDHRTQHVYGLYRWALKKGLVVEMTCPKHIQCWKCGEVGHKASNCTPAKICSYCGRYHLAYKCDLLE